MKFRIPFERVNWITSSFLIGTLFLALTATPLTSGTTAWTGSRSRSSAVMFAFTGFSITLGYHRLFPIWPSKPTGRCGFSRSLWRGAFENSALMWSSEHRRHHKYVDHEDDPYDISKGFFHAHIGWLLFKLDPQPPFDNVPDLDRDLDGPLAASVHSFSGGFGGFCAAGGLAGCIRGPVGALGGFLIGGVARVVCLQHCTFFINSACHTLGSRPYSSRCSARDSWLMALFTFGEGYHNYHHEFQHDYRNGVKPWQFDPTKWTDLDLEQAGPREQSAPRAGPGDLPG